MIIIIDLTILRLSINNIGKIKNTFILFFISFIGSQLHKRFDKKPNISGKIKDYTNINNKANKNNKVVYIRFGGRKNKNRTTINIINQIDSHQISNTIILYKGVNKNN